MVVQQLYSCGDDDSHDRELTEKEYHFNDLKEARLTIMTVNDSMTRRKGFFILQRQDKDVSWAGFSSQEKYNPITIIIITRSRNDELMSLLHHEEEVCLTRVLGEHQQE